VGLLNKALGVFAVKGGVGKTALSLSIAWKLKEKVKTGLIDTDIDNSNFAQFTNVNGVVEIDKESKKFKLYDWDGVKVFSMSLLVGRDRGVSMTEDRYVQMISDAMEFGDWDCDVIVVDLPSGSSDIWKGVLKIFGNIYMGSVIVTQPGMIDSLMKGIRIHKYYDIPILGVVENMAYFKCEHGDVYRVFGDGNVKEVCEQNNVNFLGEIPLIYPFKIPIENEVIDRICGEVVSREVPKTSFLERFKEVVEDKIKEEFEKVIIPLIVTLQKELDVKDVAVKTGFTEQRPFVISIMNNGMDKYIASIPLRLKDGKLYVLKNPQKIDYEIALSLKTFAKVVLGMVDPLDAWLNGDIRTYGVGYTQRSILAIRQILCNEDVMKRIREKYGSILRRWL
jgi:Mrp family chromosome partitioning ATPase